MSTRVLRWDLLLPGVAGAVALALLGLAATAAGALRERQTLVAEGRLLRLAHDLEGELRSEGPDQAGSTLEAARDREPDFLVALRLLAMDGTPETEVGPWRSSANRPPVRRVTLFLGPAWHLGLPRPGGGRRTLEVALVPGALTPPLVARLLVPAAAGAALILVALAMLGGRLLLRHQEEQRQTAERQRIEGLARAGAGLAHQLRTPLATIKGSCQLLLEDLEEKGGAGGKRLRTVLEQGERMDRLLARLLDFARPPEPEPQILDLATAVAERLGGLSGRGIDARARVVVEIPQGMAVRVDPEHLALILDNLVSNALELGPEEAPVTLRAAAEGDRVALEVIDRGPGPGEDPERWFEPYLTTRADGTGLGLPIARALAAANGGRLTLEPAAGGGTVARLLLSGETRA